LNKDTQTQHASATIAPHSFHYYFVFCYQRFWFSENWTFKRCYYRAGGVAQGVEHLPSKCEILNSNLSTGKKKIFLDLSFFNYSLICCESRHLSLIHTPSLLLSWCELYIHVRILYVYLLYTYIKNIYLYIYTFTVPIWVVEE
jgi:hypothetical protein